MNPKVFLSIVPAFFTVKLFQFCLFLLVGVFSDFWIFLIAGSVIGLPISLVQDKVKSYYGADFGKFVVIYIISIISCLFLFKSEDLMVRKIEHSMHEQLASKKKLKDVGAYSVKLTKVDEKNGNYMFNASIGLDQLGAKPADFGVVYADISIFGFSWWRMGINERLKK